MADVFSHPWLSGLFSDPETAALWSAEAQLSHMMRFEAAWSEAGYLAGLWSDAEGANAAAAIRDLDVDPSSFREGTAKDGLCVPALVRHLKERTGLEAIHKGSTSQDVIDTATVLCAVETLKLIEKRLARLKELLNRLDRDHGAKFLMGRTRMQAAMEMTVSNRLVSWSLPVDSHFERLEQLKPLLARVQIGGAVGDRQALGKNAQNMCDAVAASLGLGSTQHSWHAMRGNIVEFANLLSAISGTMGKIGQDVALMAQQGIDEISLSGGGRSSAMPHKQNPILAELLVTLARFNSVQISGMHHAMVHEQERSGSSWALEWMILPQMAEATGRSLSASLELLSSITAMGNQVANR